MRRYTMKHGKKVTDRRLGRIVQFDRRSRNYPIKEIVKGLTPRSYTWRCQKWLDQGNEGSCVGHGIAHELIARPSECLTVDHTYAREIIYWGAQKVDEWPGGAYPGAKPYYEGTSVLAGVKTTQSLGWFDSYRWGFNLQDLILGVGYNGPAVLGLTWYQDMMDVDEKGFIHPTGSIAGGHCILCRGVSINGQYFTLRNSWGQSWGINGDCKVSFKDMESLLAQDGESCFFIKRHVIKISGKRR